MRCRVLGCLGPMREQMLACPAHWSLLSEELRLALVEAYDIREEQQRAGNVRRDSRERWRTLVRTADEEWAALEASLQEALDQHEPHLRRQGSTWLRLVRGTATPGAPELEPAAEVADA